MVEISSNLKNLLYSNTLPKAGIKISIKRTYWGASDTDFNETYREEELFCFTEKDITNISISSSIDILGSSLPQIKINWEQNYFGKVDEQLRPIEYLNVTEGMAVDVSIIYNYTTYNFWKSFYEKKETWKGMYKSPKTWRDIFYSKEEEEVKLKRTFISSIPKVQGGKIKWETRDLLYFMNNFIVEGTSFWSTAGNSQIPLPVSGRTDLFQRVLGNFEEIAYNTGGDLGLANATNSSIVSIGFPTEEDQLKEAQVYQGTTKDVLRNALSPINCYIDFSTSGGILKKDAFSEIEKKEELPKRNIKLKNQTDFPKIENLETIRNYVFDSTTFYVDYSNPYYASSSKIEYSEILDRTEHFIALDGASTRFDMNGNHSADPENLYYVEDRLDGIVYHIRGKRSEPINVTLYKINKTTATTTIAKNTIGVDFVEKNEFNAFPTHSGFGAEFVEERANILSSYYNSKNSNVTVSFFGDPSIETGDFVEVETNLTKTSSGETVIKKGIVTSTELSYNGAIKEKMVIHELN